MFVLQLILSRKDDIMVNKRRIIALFTLMLLVIPNVTFASSDSLNSSEVLPTEIIELEVSGAINKLDFITPDELETLPIERTYSYDEALEMYKQAGATKEELAKFEKNFASKNYTRSIGSRMVIMAMDPYTFDSGLYRYSLTPKIWVELYYSGSATPDYIVSLSDANIDTSHGYGAKCSFEGTVTYRLLAGNRFSMYTYGTVYKSGQMRVSGGVRVKVHEKGEVYITIENQGSGKLRDVNFQRDYYSAAMSP